MKTNKQKQKLKTRLPKNKNLFAMDRFRVRGVSFEDSPHEKLEVRKYLPTDDDLIEAWELCREHYRFDERPSRRYLAYEIPDRKVLLAHYLKKPKAERDADAKMLKEIEAEREIEYAPERKARAALKKIRGQECA